jgi:hypothetical protein
VVVVRFVALFVFALGAAAGVVKLITLPNVVPYVFVAMPQ